MNNLTRACKALALANTYAEDGAVITAIELTSEALALLCHERERRMAAGLLPKFGATPAAMTAAANARKGKSKK